MHSLFQDLRAAIRGLLRNRGFAAAVIATMALGIGANSAIFSVVYGVVLRPLPYTRGDDLVIVRQQRPRAGIQATGVLGPRDGRLPAAGEDAGVHGRVPQHVVCAARPRRAGTRRDRRCLVELLRSLRRQAGAGPDLPGDDDRHGADAVLVLSNAYWKSRFGGDPRVVGQVFEMNDRPHTVIGVLPPIPQFPDENDVYMPVSACPFRSSEAVRTNRNARMVQAFARLRPGTPLTSTLADLTMVASNIAAGVPGESIPRAPASTRPPCPSATS